MAGTTNVRVATHLPQRAALVSFLGSMVEYYDFFIYGTAAALIFPRIFFVNVSPAAATLLALGTFGAGYVARPVGAVILGHFGDRVGRKRVLVATLVLMGGSTLAIGLLPDGRTIGNAAPLLLIVLRLMQGLSAAGEQSGANSMTLEHSPAGKRAFYTSWTLSGTQAGAVLATLVFIPISSLPEDQLFSWGWRVPFLLSAIVLAIAYMVRRTMPETPVFEHAKERNEISRFPIVPLFRDRWRSVIRVIFCALIATVSTVTGVFALNFAVKGFGVDRSTMLWASVLGNLGALFIQPLWALLSDRLGRKPVFITGVLACGVLIFPYFATLTTGSVPLIVLMTMLLQSVVYAAPNAIWPSFYAEMFPAQVRYSGTAIGTQLGFLAAGFTPVISQALLEPGPTGWIPVAVFIAACCLVSALAAATAAETRLVRTDDLGAPVA